MAHPIIVFIGSLVAAMLLPISLTAQVFEMTAGGELSFGGNAYKLFKAPAISWADAASYVDANLPGWHLATSTSSAENSFLWSAIESAWAAGGYPLQQDYAGRPVLQFWLGGYQDPPTIWNWVSGETWAYTNFGLGEPNGDNGWLGHLAIGRQNNAGWNDEGNYLAGISGFVVERTGPTVPEPSECAAWTSLGLIAFWTYRRRCGSPR